MKNSFYTSSKITLLSFVLMFIQNGSSLYAQEKEEPVRSETILKINPKTNTPFSKGQLRWIVKNGFDSVQYRWNKPDINLGIKRAINMRNNGKVLGVIGGTLLFTVITAEWTSSMTENVPDDTRARNRHNRKVAFIWSFGIISTSLTLNQIGKKRLKKANNLKLKLAK